MAAKYHRHVALTETLDRFVEIASGRYASASAVVRAALEALAERNREAVGPSLLAAHARR